MQQQKTLDPSTAMTESAKLFGVKLKEKQEAIYYHSFKAMIALYPCPQAMANH